MTLSDRRDEVVSKEDLIATIWRDLVVEESNLQVHISALRKVLGAHAIATVPGRGYQFTLGTDSTDTPKTRHDRASANLPLSLPPLIGRADDLHTLLSLMQERRVVTLSLSSAVTLFFDRVAERDHGFVIGDQHEADAADICQRLDCLPLAIELAAAWVPMLGLAGLRTRIGEHLNLFDGGPRDAPKRHQTMQSALAWSYSLLDDSHRRALRSLSVFSSSFPVNLAQHIDNLQASLDWLLAQVDQTQLHTSPALEARLQLSWVTLIYQRGEAGDCEAAECAAFLRTRDGSLWLQLDQLALLACARGRMIEAALALGRAEVHFRWRKGRRDRYLKTAHEHAVAANCFTQCMTKPSPCATGSCWLP